MASNHIFHLSYEFILNQILQIFYNSSSGSDTTGSWEVPKKYKDIQKHMHTDRNFQIIATTAVTTATTATTKATCLDGVPQPNNFS